jgi:hypothetical protein
MRSLNNFYSIMLIRFMILPKFFVLLASFVFDLGSRIDFSVSICDSIINYLCISGAFHSESLKELSIKH